MHHATSARQLSIQQQATRRNYSERGCGGRRVCNEGGARGRRSASVRGRAWGRSDGCAHDFTWLRIIRGLASAILQAPAAQTGDYGLRHWSCHSCDPAPSHTLPIAHMLRILRRCRSAIAGALAARRGGLHDERTCTHGRRRLVARQWDNRKPCARGDSEFGGRRCL